MPRCAPCSPASLRSCRHDDAKLTRRRRSSRRRRGQPLVWKRTCRWLVAVEDVGIHVGSVRPHNRSELVIHAYLPKQLRIPAQRLEHRPPQLALEVDLTRPPVIETEAHDERLKRLDRCNPGCSRSDAHSSGSIVSRGRCASAFAQFASSSARCISAHSCTSLSARGGSAPANGSSVSIFPSGPDSEWFDRL